MSHPAARVTTTNHVVAVSIPSTEDLQLLQLVYAVREQAGRDEEKDHRRRNQQLLQAGLLAHSEDEVSHGKPDDDAKQPWDGDGLRLRMTSWNSGITASRHTAERKVFVDSVGTQLIPQTKGH